MEWSYSAKYPPLFRSNLFLTFIQGKIGSVFTFKQAYLSAEHICTIRRPEGEIRIEANESLASDAQMFRFQSRVDIRVGGKTHFTKSWRAARARLLD
jgi:hypothetical protein